MMHLRGKNVCYRMQAHTWVCDVIPEGAGRILIMQRETMP